MSSVKGVVHAGSMRGCDCSDVCDAPGVELPDPDEGYSIIDADDGGGFIVFGLVHQTL